MLDIKNHVLKTYKKIGTRGWDTVYWAVDIHDTIVKSNYKADEIPKEFLPGARKVLRRLSKRSDTKLIMYTCSYPHEIEKYLEFFKENGIIFHYVNENPEAKNTAYGFYDKKLYAQIILDDKAGFVSENWEHIHEAILTLDHVERNKKWAAEHPDYFTNYRTLNKDVIADRMSKWYEANPDYRREQHLRRTYGLTLEEFDYILLSQGGVCPICKTATEKWHVDHDHVNGEVRGILCMSCNTSLGMLKEDIEIMKNMITYIELNKLKHESKA